MIVHFYLGIVCVSVCVCQCELVSRVKCGGMPLFHGEPGKHTQTAELPLTVLYQNEIRIIQMSSRPVQSLELCSRLPILLYVAKECGENVCVILYQLFGDFPGAYCIKL